MIIDSYIPFLIERRGQCAQHSCDECSACRRHRDTYILFPRATNSTLLTNYYYICDIKFQRNEALYKYTKEEGHPYSSYESSVENVRPLLNEEFLTLKYDENPNYIDDNIIQLYLLFSLILRMV